MRLLRNSPVCGRTASNRRPWLSWCLTAVALLICPSAVLGELLCADGWHWADDLHLAGRLGGREVRGYLGEGYATAETNGVFGVFFYPSGWTPSERARQFIFALDGIFAKDCSVTVHEINEGGQQRATWQLHFVTDERLEGRRQDTGGASLAVSLNVARVPDCSVRGVWHRFTSARWPITFQYPASWRLAEEGDTITLVCPDPSRLAIGGLAIVLQLNPPESQIEADDRRSGTLIDNFMTFDTKTWMIGDCESRPASEPYRTLLRTCPQVDMEKHDCAPGLCRRTSSVSVRR